MVGAVLTVAGCGGSESADSSTTAPTSAPANATTTSPYGEAPAIDPPGPNEVVLTVTGPAGTAEYTLAQLRQRATTKLTVDEPFVKQRIEFAGVPSLRCPLTFNHRTFRVQLDALSPQSTVRGGSMLGDAIRLAASSLAGEGAGKAIVILSDGEDMQSEPVEAAAVAAKEQGIRVVTIGIGDATEGARIPVYERGQRRYIVHEGQEVWSRMNPKLLKQVADAGEGYFVEAGVAQADMDQLGRLLSGSLEKSTRERSDVSTKQPLFQLFAGAALVLLLAEMLLAPRVRRDASSTTVAGSTPS